MINNIIKELQSKNHYGIGNNIEIAKGKNELITSFTDFKTKIKRQWRLKKP